MECTNHYNLPPEVFKALTKNRYSGDEGDIKTDYSITSLIAPVRQTILKKRHPGHSADDAIDRLWSMFGHMMHDLLEEHGCDLAITERRFYKTIHGRVISGQIDHYKDKKLTDYKCTSVYKVKKKNYDDWSKQLNLYSLFLEDEGHPVYSLRIIAVCRDWRRSEAYEKGYPEVAIVIIPLVKWSRAARERYLEARVLALICAESLPEEELPECTPEERWQETTDWAILREGRKNAVRKFNTREEAMLYLREHGQEGDDIVRRYSQPKRCLGYCSVSTICSQHKKYLESVKERKDVEQVNE